jgi:hypothetical protein
MNQKKIEMIRLLYPSGQRSLESWKMCLSSIKVLRPDDWKIWLAQHTITDWKKGQLWAPRWWSPMWVLIQEDRAMIRQDRAMIVEELVDIGLRAGYLFQCGTVHGLDNPGPLDIEENPEYPESAWIEKSFVKLSNRLPEVPPLDF